MKHILPAVDQVGRFVLPAGGRFALGFESYPSECRSLSNGNPYRPSIIVVMALIQQTRLVCCLLEQKDRLEV
jgi:hypothetical protein